MILLSSSLGNELNVLLAISGFILVFGLLLKRINQPYIVAYILTGVILGPYGLQIVTESETAETLGELGLIILMFFIGIEISLKDFLGKWRLALLGTGLQILFSLAILLLIGIYMDWTFKRMLLLGFVISLSSSAVVIKLIEDNKISKTKVGQNVISILLTQDIMIVPMIILMSFIGGGKVDLGQVVLQLTGGVLIIVSIIYLLKNKSIKIPFSNALKNDHELQVFGGLIICFGMAFLTSIFQLSAGLGAFVAGLFVHATTSTKWLHDSLHSFRVVLISIFFLSIGMLIDVEFLASNWQIISMLVLVVYLSNHGINTIALKILGNKWKESIYGGSLLAQIGEFSFVLASLGFHTDIITSYSYQMTVIVISITILISPFWVQLSRFVLKLDLRTLPK